MRWSKIAQFNNFFYYFDDATQTIELGDSVSKIATVNEIMSILEISLHLSCKRWPLLLSSVAIGLQHINNTTLSLSSISPGLHFNCVEELSEQ